MIAWPFFNRVGVDGKDLISGIKMHITTYACHRDPMLSSIKIYW